MKVVRFRIAETAWLSRMERRMHDNARYVKLTEKAMAAQPVLPSHSCSPRGLRP